MNIRTLRRCLAMLLLGLAPRQERDPAEVAFLAGLDAVDAEMADQEWGPAQRRLLSLLEEHGDADHVVRQRPRVVQALASSSFWSAYDEPRPKQLISGELVKYGESSGQIRLRYQVGQLDDFWVLGEPNKRRLPDPEVLYLHPAPFAGPYRIEIEGSRYPSQLPLPLVITDYGLPQACVVGFGTEPPERLGTWYKAFIGRISDHGVDLVDSVARPPVESGERFTLKVRVENTRITAFYNGRKILSAKRDPGGFGHVGFAGLDSLDLVELQGKAERSWIEGLRDAELWKQRADPEQSNRVDELLPPGLRLSGVKAPAGLDLELAAYPGAQEDELERLLGEGLVFARQHDGPGGDAWACGLDEESSPPAFRSWMRAFFAFQQGSLEQSLDLCLEVRAAEPAFRPARELEAELYLRLDRRDEARGVYEAMASEETSGWTYLRLVQLAVAGGRYEHAGKVIDEAIHDGMYTRELDELNGRIMKTVRGPSWPERFVHDTEHFTICSDMSRRVCIEAGRKLESALTQFEATLRPFPQAERRMDVLLFSGRAGYLAYLEGLAGGAEHSAGVYMSDVRQLCIWNLPSHERMMRTVRHEGFHQYLHMLVEDAPTWLNEGLAEYFEAADFTKGSSRQHGPNPEHLARLARDGFELVPLKQFLFQDSAQFMSDPGLHYAQAWALVYFLRHSTPEHRELFDRILDASVEAGQGGRDVLEGALEGVPLHQLEADFRRGVRKLASLPSLGR